MLMKKAVTWIVVADGARARIVRQSGVGKPLEAVPGQEFVNPEQGRTREIGTDKPGRTFDSTRVGHRHGMDEVDWHRFEKKKFAKSIAEHLERAAQAKAFDRLVIVAPPDTLGDIRAEIGKHGTAKIAAEVPKDLTNAAITDLPGHLGDAVRVAEQEGPRVHTARRAESGVTKD
jgi:protein required for attachment to host cells